MVSPLVGLREVIDDFDCSLLPRGDIIDIRTETSSVGETNLLAMDQRIAVLMIKDVKGARVFNSSMNLNLIAPVEARPPDEIRMRRCVVVP